MVSQSTLVGFFTSPANLIETRVKAYALYYNSWIEFLQEEKPIIDEDKLKRAIEATYELNRIELKKDDIEQAKEGMASLIKKCEGNKLFLRSIANKGQLVINEFNRLKQT